MLKIGVFGAGHLGTIHLKQWKEVSGVTLIGFYDPNKEKAAAIQAELGIKPYASAEELIDAADALDVVSTTVTHYEIAKKVILAGKHLFIEKPLAQSLTEAQELVQLVKEANIKCQVGHVERYNPAYLALEEQTLQPMFIEAHRLAQFNPRGTDVSVILDLMIHDIDIVMHLVKSPVRRISASGVSVVSESADIANARIEFDNGCVANLTSSRISIKNMRKMRLFQQDAYIGIDFLDKKTEVISLKEADAPKGQFDFPIAVPGGGEKTLSIQMPEVQNVNAIRMELQEFADAIINDKAVRVTVYDGYQAMDVAHQVLKKMSLHNELHNI